jgi:hypothetical protein
MSGIFPQPNSDSGADIMEELMASIGLDSVPKAFDILRDPSHSITGVSKGDHSRSTTAEEDMKAFIPEAYWDYKDVFMKTTFDTLPEHSEFDHAINLKDDFTPQRGKLYKLSPREQDDLDAMLNENLASGRIRPSKSPQAAPFFFVKKFEEINAPGQDAGLRPVQDYHYLNAHTIRDRYPLPLLSEIL